MPYLIFISSLIMPIYALGFAMVQCIKKRTTYLPIISISLAFATIGFALSPTEELDLYRHYERIEAVGNLSFQNIIGDLSSGYFLFDIYAWVIKYLGLPKEFFTASVIFVSYFLVLNIFNDLKKKYLSNSNSLTVAYSLIILLLSVNFIYLSSGLRNTFANITIFYACYYLVIYNKKALFFFCTIFAFLVHPASVIPAAIVLTASTSSWLSKFAKPMVILALFLMLGNKAVDIIIGYIDSLASSLPFYSSTYLDPDSTWGGGFREDASLRGWIVAYIIDRLPTYISILYLIILKPKQKNTLYLILCISLLLLSILFSYQTAFSRLNYFYIYIFSVFLILEYSKDKNSLNKYFIFLYFISLLVIMIVTSYSFNEYLSSAIEVFYKPLAFIVADL